MLEENYTLLVLSKHEEFPLKKLDCTTFKNECRGLNMQKVRVWAWDRCSIYDMLFSLMRDK